MVDCHVTAFLAMTVVVCLCERSEAKQSKATDGGLPRHCVPRNDDGSGLPRHCVPRNDGGSGLPRHCVPRNDDGGLSLRAQ